MPKVKKLSAFDCLKGCCGRRQKVPYQDNEDDFMLTPLASLPSVEVDISSPNLEVSGILWHEAKTFLVASKLTVEEDIAPHHINYNRNCKSSNFALVEPEEELVEVNTSSTDEELEPGVVKVDVLPPPRHLEVFVEPLIIFDTQEIEISDKVVTFECRDLEQDEFETKFYPKTPIKRSEKFSEEELESIAQSVVATVISSALSYFLATLTVRRALESSTILFEPETVFDEMTNSSASEISEKGEAAPEHVKSILSEIIDSLEVQKETEPDDLYQIGDGNTAYVVDQTTENGTESGTSTSTMSEQSLTTTVTDTTTTANAFDEESSISSLEWDGDFDVTAPLMRSIPTE